MVFVVGGNGGNAAAHAIQEECEAQGVLCSVVGVPKSIDNDILLVSGVVVTIQQGRRKQEMETETVLFGYGNGGNSEDGWTSRHLLHRNRARSNVTRPMTHTWYDNSTPCTRRIFFVGESASQLMDN